MDLTTFEFRAEMAKMQGFGGGGQIKKRGKKPRRQKGRQDESDNDIAR